MTTGYVTDFIPVLVNFGVVPSELRSMRNRIMRGLKKFSLDDTLSFNQYWSVIQKTKG